MGLDLVAGSSLIRLQHLKAPSSPSFERMHFEAALSGRAYVELLDGRSTWGPLVRHLKLDGPKDARRVMSVCSYSLLVYNGGG